MERVETASRLGLGLRIVLFCSFFWMVKGILVPILLGALLALLLDPIERGLARRLGRLAGAAPWLLSLASVLLVLVPLALLGVQLGRVILKLGAVDWAASFDKLELGVLARLARLSEQLGFELPSLRDTAGALASKTGGWLSGYVAETAGALPAIVIGVFLFVCALFYFLKDGRSMVAALRRLSPFSEEETEALFHTIQGTVRGAILGSLITATVQGILVTIALLVWGVPGALLLGGVATLLALTPMVGTPPVTLGATLYLAWSEHPGAAVGMLISAVLIGLSDNLVRPWVQATQGRMHPLAALLGIFGGLGAIGVSGIFFGPVVVAMVLWALDAHRPRAASRKPEVEAP